MLLAEFFFASSLIVMIMCILSCVYIKRRSKPKIFITITRRLPTSRKSSCDLNQTSEPADKCSQLYAVVLDSVCYRDDVDTAQHGAVTAAAAPECLDGAEDGHGSLTSSCLSSTYAQLAGEVDGTTQHTAEQTRVFPASHLCADSVSPPTISTISAGQAVSGAVSACHQLPYITPLTLSPRSHHHAHLTADIAQHTAPSVIGHRYTSQRCSGESEERACYFSGDSGDSRGYTRITVREPARALLLNRPHSADDQDNYNVSNASYAPSDSLYSTLEESQYHMYEALNPASTTPSCTAAGTLGSQHTAARISYPCDGPVSSVHSDTSPIVRYHPSSEISELYTRLNRPSTQPSTIQHPAPPLSSLEQTTLLSVAPVSTNTDAQHLPGCEREESNMEDGSYACIPDKDPVLDGYQTVVNGDAYEHLYERIRQIDEHAINDTVEVADERGSANISIVNDYDRGSQNISTAENFEIGSQHIVSTNGWDTGFQDVLPADDHAGFENTQPVENPDIVVPAVLATDILRTDSDRCLSKPTTDKVDLVTRIQQANPAAANMTLDTVDSYSANSITTPPEFTPIVFSGGKLDVQYYI